MSETLWAKTAVAVSERPALSGVATVDVCVVGAGVGGIATSYFLAAGGASVMLLDADRIGSGAVGKSSGFANAGLWIPPSDIIKAIGETYGRRLTRTLADAPQRTFDLIKSLGLECDADNNGTLQCAPDQAAFDDLRERLDGMAGKEGDLKLVGAAETAKLTGTSAYRGALVDFRAGILQPLSYVRSLASAAEAAGALIHERSPALDFKLVGDSWHVSTRNGTISAKWLLIATEAHMIGLHFGLLREYVPMPYFNAATRPLTIAERVAVMPARQPIVDLRKVVSSYRYDAQGRLVIGSIGEVKGLDGVINRQWISRKIASLFPVLRGVSIDYAWAGTIGVTGNHIPTVHRIGHQALSIGGFNGRGIAAGTALGELISRVILGKMPEQDLPVPITEPKVASMAKLRGMGLRAGAAVFHMMDARRAD